MPEGERGTGSEREACDGVPLSRSLFICRKSWTRRRVDTFGQSSWAIASHQPASPIMRHYLLALQYLPAPGNIWGTRRCGPMDASRRVHAMSIIEKGAVSAHLLTPSRLCRRGSSHASIPFRFLIQSPAGWAATCGLVGALSRPLTNPPMSHISPRRPQSRRPSTRLERPVAGAHDAPWQPRRVEILAHPSAVCLCLPTRTHICALSAGTRRPW